MAVAEAAADARKCMIEVPLAKGQSFPSPSRKGGAVVMLRPGARHRRHTPASACAPYRARGLQNCFAKQLSSSNPLNNAAPSSRGSARCAPKQVAAEPRLAVKGSSPPKRLVDEYSCFRAERRRENAILALHTSTVR